jgi:hypothetical protein
MELLSVMGLYLSLPFSSSRQYSAGPYHVLFAKLAVDTNGRGVMLL